MHNYNNTSQKHSAPSLCGFLLKLHLLIFILALSTTNSGLQFLLKSYLYEITTDHLLFSIWFSYYCIPLLVYWAHGPLDQLSPSLAFWLVPKEDKYKHKIQNIIIQNIKHIIQNYELDQCLINKIPNEQICLLPPHLFHSAVCFKTE